MRISKETRDEMSNYLVSLVDRFPDGVPDIMISEFAEQRRILPPNTPFPGRWENRRTPYLVEIMDSLAANSPYQHVALLKAAQVGATAAMENVIAYYIGVSPAEIMFISGSEDLAKDWAESRMDPAIDTFGLRDRIFVQTESKNKSNRMGDRAMKKEFPGGALTLVSAQAAGKLRSKPIRILIRDEIDAAPRFLKSGEGGWLEVSEERTSNFEHSKRIFDASTPTTIEDSGIYQQYLLGDQRIFLVACPLCGAYQQLTWGRENGNHGMRPIRKGGVLEGAYYICEHCHDAFFDHHKQQILDSGHWEPTTQASYKFMRSYHISSLYAPAGGLSFMKLWIKWEKAQRSEEDMVNFVNLNLGMPFKQKGSRPKIEQVIELRSNYIQGKIPSDEILFLTLAVDVQAGSRKKGKERPERLELEVCGHGDRRRTWSIEHIVIEGGVTDPHDGAWAEFANMLRGSRFRYKRADGREIFPVLSLVDSGAFTDTVYAFCRERTSMYPSKGFNYLKKNKNVVGDQMSRMDISRYRKVNAIGDLMLVLMSTNFYKATFYTDLHNTYKNLEDRQNNWGFCEFPADYSDEFFQQLTAEERRLDGSFYNPGSKPNEALDLRVMNLCAGDIFIDSFLDELKVEARRQKLPQHEIEKINHKIVLERLKQLTRK